MEYLNSKREEYDLQGRMQRRFGNDITNILDNDAQIAHNRDLKFAPKLQTTQLREFEGRSEMNPNKDRIYKADPKHIQLAIIAPQKPLQSKSNRTEIEFESECMVEEPHRRELNKQGLPTTVLQSIQQKLRSKILSSHAIRPTSGGVADSRINAPRKLAPQIKAKDQQKQVNIIRNTPQSVSDYQADIFEFCMKREIGNICKSNYFGFFQESINDKMRAILIDWLIDVHAKFKMLPQTLFQSINLIDRALEKFQCPRTDLQLVGVTCLFISAKYEEIYPPDLCEFSIVCDRTYSEDQIIKMEGRIITALDFELVFTSSYQFHELFCNKLSIVKTAYHLGIYFLYLSTMECSMVKFRPSQLALASIYISNKLLSGSKWIPDLPQVVGCSEQEIKNCALELFLLAQKVKRSNLSGVTRLFATDKYSCVSELDLRI